MFDIKDYSFKLNENCVKIIEGHIASNTIFDGINGKLESVLQDYQRLFIFGLLEVRGVFSEEEVTLMKAAIDGAIRDGSLHPKNYLMLEIEGACKYKGLDEFFEVNQDKLIEKIKSLGLLECYSLLMLLFMFREYNDTNSLNEDEDITNILIEGKDKENKLIEEFVSLIDIR